MVCLQTHINNISSRWFARVRKTLEAVFQVFNSWFVTGPNCFWTTQCSHGFLHFYFSRQNLQGSFPSPSRVITGEVSLTPLQVIASVSIAAGGVILRVSLARSQKDQRSGLKTLLETRSTAK